MRLVFGAGIFGGTIGGSLTFYHVLLVGNLGGVAAYLRKHNGTVAQVFGEGVLAFDAFVA
jgi:hypothetical protein